MRSSPEARMRRSSRSWDSGSISKRVAGAGATFGTGCTPLTESLLPKSQPQTSAGASARASRTSLADEPEQQVLGQAYPVSVTLDLAPGP